MTRKLFLHIGTQKTGSSFLQHMLRTNSPRLQDKGVAYLGFTEDYVSSGNGDALLGAARAGQSLEDFRRTLDGYFGGSSVAIISSELLYTTALKGGWRYLLHRLRECEVRVEMIVFFRNPVDYLRSAYSQSVKRHGFSEDFAHYIDTFSPDLYDAPLRQIVAETEAAESEARLHAFDYDSASRAGLWAVFLGACGLDCSEFTQEQVSVNPSLNASQLLLHRIYNELHPGDTSDFFSNFLVENGILAGAEPLGVTEMEFEAIKARFAPALEYVNRFISGEPVKLSPPPTFSGGSRNLVMHADDIARLMRPMFSADFAHQALSRGLSRIVHQCKHADPELKRRYPDFDPVTYLVCNPDLVQAKVDPYWHFENFGRLEGRRYKIAD